MRRHPIRKFFGLIVLYSVIIIGIFILQFKTESIISQNIGSLSFTLAQVEQEDNKTELRNQLQVNFKGLSFIANDSTPALVSNSNVEGSETPLVLTSWSKPTELSAEFTFSDGSSITFAVTDTSSTAQLSILTSPSSGNDTLSIVYKTTGGYIIKENLSNRLLISSKTVNYALTASLISSDRITFTEGSLVASYMAYDPTKRFSFETIVGYPLADQKTFDSNVKQLRGDLITKFTQSLSSVDSLTEQEVISYVAEMSVNGRYDDALDSVPDSFKRGNKRTYVSAPYFDNMITMNNSLVMQLDKLNSMVTSSLSSNNLDIFTVDGIEDYILLQKRTQKIRNLLSMTSTQSSFKPTLSQATGIISVYIKLYSDAPSLAELLEPSLQKCIDSIIDSCSVEDQKLALVENDSALSIEDTIITGSKLIALGSIQNSEPMTSAGYLLVNTAISSTDSLSLSTLGTIYPYIINNSNYYPHAVIFGYYNEVPVWAWTCSNSITYAKEMDGTIDINITFPLGETHYIIFNGVPTFHSNIEIQQQRFRTDPRFETYNSSGYVYEGDSQTLFIKSRHKSQVELIRLFCDVERTFVSSASELSSNLVTGSGSSQNSASGTSASSARTTAASTSTPAASSPTKPASNTTAPASSSTTATGTTTAATSNSTAVTSNSTAAQTSSATADSSNSTTADTGNSSAASSTTAADSTTESVESQDSTTRRRRAVPTETPHGPTNN